jgi:hypothetical protein
MYIREFGYSMLITFSNLLIVSPGTVPFTLVKNVTQGAVYWVLYDACIFCAPAYT